MGNNRVVANASGGIVQTNHFYPFGMSFAEGVTSSGQPYKYNGKELDTERGLNLYDYSARLMDPALGRFSTVDPLAEKYYNWSPYIYVGNNPMKFVDPTGNFLTDFENKHGNLIKHIDDGSSAVFQQTGEGVNLHYEFNGYNPNSSGSKSVNLTSAIQEQQQLNLENPALQQNAEGYNETHCNQATQNVMKTVDSAIEN